MGDSLVDRTRAALDEDERVAREALRNPCRHDTFIDDYVDTGVDDGEWKADGCYVETAHPHPGEGLQGGITIYDEGGHTEDQAQHIARHDPARVLRQVAAMRKVLEVIESDLADDGTDETARYLLAALAEALGIEADTPEQLT